MLRPKPLDLRTFLLTWFLAAPVGFSLWVVAWKTYGAGTGQVSTFVGLIAVLGWCAWHRGLYVALIDRQLRQGFTFCVVSILSMSVVKVIIGRGIAPIELSLTAAIVGAAIPFSFGLVAKANDLRCVLLRRFGTPAWRFLNQPIVFR